MYVRFTCLTFPPERLLEAKQVYSAEVAPAIRKQQGNREAILLEPEDETQEFISYTSWDSEADLKAFEESQAYQSVIGRIKQVATAAYQKHYKAISR